MDTCITRTCTNPVPVPGTKCTTCDLWYRAYIASGASDHLTWDQYVEIMQEEQEEAEGYYATMESVRQAEAKWEIG